MKAYGLATRSSLLAVIAVGLGLVACESLTPPGVQQTALDGGTTEGGTTSDGAVGPEYIPANAILGPKGQLQGFDLLTWHTFDENGVVDTFSWSLPMALITAVEGGQFGEATAFAVSPDVAQQTWTRAVDMAYRPLGHFPVGVYDVPHVDFHLLHISSAEFAATDCADPTLVEGEFMPPTFFSEEPPLNCVAGMGIHGYNRNAPEFNAERFTSTVHLNTYGGRITGIEIAVTGDLLKERKDVSFPLMIDVKPAKFQEPVRYPTELVAKYWAKEDLYTYTVSNFVDIGP